MLDQQPVGPTPSAAVMRHEASIRPSACMPPSPNREDPGPVTLTVRDSDAAWGIAGQWTRSVPESLERAPDRVNALVELMGPLTEVD